ncbi:MAG: PLP-dependent aminotransferase family protein [Acidimicrobiales bacterium]
MIEQASSTPTDPSADQLAGVVSGWADSGHGALAQRLALALRRAIAAGVIVDGARLPPERELARSLSVSRSTVTAALDRLRADALVESRQGSGSRVRGIQRSVGSSRIAEHFSEGRGVDLASGNPPDPSHWPPLSIDVADLIAEGGGPGVQPLGLPALRAALAARHAAAGRPTDAEEVHVTAGAHQAIALTVGMCAGPGDAVAVEDTSYPGIFDILDARGAKTLPLPTDSAGILPGPLERALVEHHPRVLYIQSGPHNPTGRIPSVGRLRALAQILDNHETVVVEDCALADLTFSGRVRPELADLCRRAVIVSVGSFSKVAWGGLRVGWLRAPAPLVEATMHLRLANDLGASVPAQLLALRLLPHLDDMAARRRVTLEERIDKAVERLRADFPTWNLVAPGGGSVLWVASHLADSGPLVQLAGRHGVQVAPGAVARAHRVADPHIRICVDRPWEVVETGLRRLWLATRELDRPTGLVLG